MKMLLKFITAIFASALLFAAAPASAQGKIATVNLNKLFDDYWKTKQAKAAFEDQKTDLEKEGKGMMADYNKKESDYKTLVAASNDQALADSERERKKRDAEEVLKELKDRQEAIVKFQKGASATLDERARRMRDNILSEVRKVVESKAKSLSYALVIDVGAESLNSTPIVLYSSGENDITASVLEQLNANAPPEASTVTPTPAPKKGDEKSGTAPKK